MKKTIAITGGIGSGKSTVSKILKDGNIVCLGYFGVKKDLPHFVRTLKLYGEK